MAYNLTITIGDDLWEAIQKWRDRLQIAKICQRALEVEVRKLEDLPKEVLEMEKTIERLRKEKEDFSQESYAKGYEQGCAWAKEASYGELTGFTDSGTRELLRSHILPGQLLIPEAEWHTKIEVEQDERVRYDDLEYQRGWLAAVIDLWDTVGNKI